MKYALSWITTILLATLLPAPPVAAASVSGQVVDAETGKPIPGATVRLLEGKSVATDKHGGFQIESDHTEPVRLLITHVSYDSSDTLTVTAAPHGTRSLEIRLNPKPWVLNDVVVTGTRSPHLLKDVPVQTEVITQRDFERTGAVTVDQALASAIGVQITEDLSGQGAQIRGIEGDRVLVLVDGERAVGRVRGSIDLSQFSLSNVRKIEVVKGTGSTLYGSDAMGGVINIITKNPRYNTVNGRIYTDFGTHTSYQPSAEFAYGSEKLALTLGAKWFATDGFDLDQSTRHTNGVEATDRVNINSRAKLQLSPTWSLTGSGRVMWEEKEWIEEEARSLNAHGDSLFKAFDDVERNYRYEGSVGLDYLSDDRLSMSLRLFGTLYDHDWHKYDTAGFWVDTSRTEDVFAELSYNANYTIAEGHVATAGLSATHQDLSSTELIDAAEPDRSIATYLQYEYAPTEHWSILPGIRYERHNSFGSHVNPSFNLMYSLVDRIKLRGFVGYGFRAPSIKEQYFIFDHTAAGYIVYGGRVPFGKSGQTSDLKEEVSINSSISAELSSASLGLHRVTYYYNHLEDLIDFELQDFAEGYWRGRYVYRNVDAAVTQGIEWQSRLRLSDAVDLSVSYTYLHNVILDTDSIALSPGGDTTRTEQGNKLINRPDHSLKWYLTGFHRGTGLGASVWGSFHSKKLFISQSNTGEQEGTPDEYAPARTTLNLNVFKRWQNGLEIFVRMENMFDQTDVTYGYWPGRQVFVGLTYDLALQ
ncbi:TonB-dependent receptor [candidate division GN15 bacterium]|nr:TonB-dependent receptor [candidate division GN15 bacterium]